VNNNKIIYLDNAAAMPVEPEVLRFYSENFEAYYSNQEAFHKMAYAARRRIVDAARTLSFYLTGDEETGVFWANSGTEAINAAVNSIPLSGKNVITTEIEHPALSNALKRQQSVLSCLPVSRGGKIDFDKAANVLNKNTALVAVHHVQSETGTLQDIVRLRKLMDMNSPEALLMVDSIQSVSKIPLPWQEAKVDFAFISGRKVGAPGGAAVFCRSAERFEKLLEQRNKHHQSGRIEPAMALTLAHVIEKRAASREPDFAHINELNKHLRKILVNITLKNDRKINFTVPGDSASPYIIHLTVPGFQGAVLVRAIAEKGAMIASGSACESETGKPSVALTAMGFKRNEAFSALRLSLSNKTTIDELDSFSMLLEEVLRSY